MTTEAPPVQGTTTQPPPTAPAAQPAAPPPATPALTYATMDQVLNTPEGRAVASFLGVAAAGAAAAQPKESAPALSKADLEAAHAQAQEALAKLQKTNEELSAFKQREQFRQAMGDRKFVNPTFEKAFFDHIQNGFKVNDQGIVFDGQGRAVQVEGRFATMGDVIQAQLAGDWSHVLSVPAAPAHLNGLPPGAPTGEMTISPAMIDQNPLLADAIRQSGQFGKLAAGMPIKMDHPAIQAALKK